jgi:lysophospholipase L1-like esterase
MKRMHAAVPLFTAVLATILAVPVVAEEEGFVSLFDGKTLAGWTKAGGEATYSVEDGCIVGRVGPGRNTFLCTEKTYGDFIFKVELKFDVPGNSGIQIRSHKRPDGVVFGYQCEVDPSARGWSGGIYDESRRGWLYTLGGEDKEAARKAFKVDDWNEFVIQAKGPSIKTWINGVACAELNDKVDLEGFIALQVHSGKQGQIRWRNIRIKDLGRSEPAPSRWEPTIAAFEAQDRENPPPAEGILFLGSSSIRMWDVKKWFPDLPVINRGFGGSQIADSVEFADRIVLPCRPKVIVFYAGDNDTAAGKTPEQITGDFKMLVQKVHKALPKTRIVVLAIKPSAKRWQFIERVRETNRLIRAQTEKDPRLVFVDVEPPMLGADGKPRAELFLADGLHLNAEGYALWTSLVRPHLEK